MMFEELVLENVPIKFPYVPYEVQKTYMEKVIQCLNEKKFGLLESPTGTGKTLALLCASLAWLQSSNVTKLPPGGVGGGADADIKALLRGESWTSNLVNNSSSRCRIIYASRTHSQLAQVIGEFNRCPYSHVSCVILASREQLCINEDLATSSGDKTQLCKAKRKTKSCQYYNNIENTTTITEDSSIGDIESLRKHGHKRKLCPYYVSRDLASRADLIFLPYNYLVDPRIRKSLAINLDECVVIIDEAHNVLRIFEDSSSTTFTAKDVAVALGELDFVMDFYAKAEHEAEMYSEIVSNMPNVDLAQVYALKDCLGKLETGLLEFAKQALGSTKEYTGEEIVRIFDKCGVNIGNATIISTAIGNVLDCLSVLSLASGSSSSGSKGKGLGRMAELVDMLFLESSQDVFEKMKSYYRFHVEKKKMYNSSSEDTEFNLWCFHPGFSLQSLVKCNIRTLVLTSGTLKPLESFQAELSAEFPVWLENGHVINAATQINYQVIPKGPDGQDLLSTFQSRSNPKYLTSLGLAIMEIARVVPDGLLVFFASYAWLDTCVNHWKTQGVWDRINGWKECYVEPRDRNVLAKMVTDFRAKVKSAAGNGACFMAVCRGKVSEGIDFADADARAVIITGIPYPSVRDPKVNLKKKFLDSNNQTQKKKGLSGSEWYNLEAFRAVNQAVGRVIRHKDDFGAVLLLDKRFCQDSYSSKLPTWLNKPDKPESFRQVITSLVDFFTLNKNNKPKAKAMGVSKKRPPLKSTNIVKQPAKKQKKIVIKSRVVTSDDEVLDNKQDIQQFVLSLKGKLEKKQLKVLVGHIKQYKEHGSIEGLLETLKLYADKKTINSQDIQQFRAFVRPEDELAFNQIVE